MRYHALATNNNLKHWQVQSQVERTENDSLSPSCETTIEDAKIVLGYFRWIIDSGYVAAVQIQLKTAFANLKKKKT